MFFRSNELERLYPEVFRVVMNVYSLMRLFLKHALPFPVDHLLQNTVVIQVQTKSTKNPTNKLSKKNSILTYIQRATIDIGKAESAVNKRQPWVGTSIIAIRYSNILPNDQNNSITMMIFARVFEGKYSSIKVELEQIENNYE
jgi:hypothetical protein